VWTALLALFGGGYAAVERGSWYLGAAVVSWVVVFVRAMQLRMENEQLREELENTRTTASSAEHQ